MNAKVKAYYVIKYRDGYVRKNADNPGVATFLGTREEATRFDTVTKLLTFVQQAVRHSNEDSVKRGWTLTYLSDRLNIVRVEETEAVRSVEKVDTKWIDSTKPVVLYNVRKQQYLKLDEFGNVTSAATINEAAVYESLSTALSAPRAYVTVGIPEEIKTYNVYITTSAPKITETVLK